MNRMDLSTVLDWLGWTFYSGQHSSADMLELVPSIVPSISEQFDVCIQRIRSNQKQAISELYYNTILMSLVDLKRVVSSRSEVLGFLDSTKHGSGGFRPYNSREYDWQNQPRMYSTFYSLGLLDVLTVLDDFLSQDKDWVITTYNWLSERQLDEGSNAGSFVENDAPSSIFAENVHWGLRSIDTIHNYVDDAEPSFEVISNNSVRWLHDYLSDRNRWSLTSVAHALFTLRRWGSTTEIAESVGQQILDFVDSLWHEGGFFEFDHELAKKRYRDDGTPQNPMLHSTLHALQILQILDQKSTLDVYLPQAKGFVMTRSETDGFGEQVWAKSYAFGPKVTPLETLCAFVILAS